MRIRRPGLSSLPKVGGFKHEIWIFLPVQCRFLNVCYRWKSVCHSDSHSLMIAGPHRGLGHPNWCVHHNMKTGLHCCFKTHFIITVIIENWTPLYWKKALGSGFLHCYIYYYQDGKNTLTLRCKSRPPR